MNTVAILTYQNSSLFELACAVELFGLTRPEFPNWYRAEVITLNAALSNNKKRSLNSTCNVSINVKQTDSLTPYSMLVIPSWPTDNAKITEILKREILKFHQHSKTIISFCSGAFLLAELGILDNRQATTHWQYANKFKRRFPRVEYLDDVLYVFNQTVGTSAGSASAIDLGLAVIRRDFGSDIASQVARRLVMSPHRKGGQSQYVETPLPQKESIFSATLDWALGNLDSDISIDDLASKSHMSRRTFDRRFRSTHGCSAKQWLITQRLNLAKVALERSGSSIEQIAQSAGFESANALRHHFRKSLGVSPRQYRDQFSSLTNHLA